MPERSENTIENAERLRDATLVILERDNDGVRQICLAMKREDRFGAGRYNGYGGKVHDGESINDVTEREVKEEAGVVITEKRKVAELSFYFPHKPELNQKVHVYFATTWIGEPWESEEMKGPEWFDTYKIPYYSMWSADKLWLPEVLKGNFVKAKCVFGEGDVVKEYSPEV